jgi:hypothetical protein
MKLNGVINRCEYTRPKGFIPGKITKNNRQQTTDKIKLLQSFLPSVLGEEGYSLSEGIN